MHIESLVQKYSKSHFTFQNAIVLTSNLNIFQVDLDGESAFFAENLRLSAPGDIHKVVSATVRHFWVCLDGNVNSSAEKSFSQRMWCKRPNHVVAANIRYFTALDHTHKQYVFM